ncbi:MAG: hypothetical protein ACI8S6_004161 [Myxococcota bacterium]|jgi:hypothetical protein
MNTVQVVSGVYVILSLLSCLAVIGTIVYSTLDIFAPTSDFLSFDLRVVTIVVSSGVLGVVALIGLLYSGAGLAVSLLTESARPLWTWWAGQGLLFGIELCAAGLAFLGLKLSGM